jgi:hypothetical protein
VVAYFFVIDCDFFKTGGGWEGDGAEERRRIRIQHAARDIGSDLYFATYPS